MKDRNRLIDTETILMVANGREGGRVGEQGEGAKKYILIITE